MQKGIFEEYLRYINKKNRLKKAVPSLIFLGVYATAYAVMICALALKNAPVAFVCSLVILVCTVFLIAKPLTTNEKMGVLGWIEAITYFTVSIILISAYVFNIVSDSYKTIAITILSTSVGGLLTLYGVGITIKYSRIDKREDELKRIKPVVVTISNEGWEKHSFDKKYSFAIVINEDCSDLKKAGSKSKKCAFEPIRVANLGDSIVTINGIYVNLKYVKFDFESVLVKNSFNELVIEHKFEFNDQIEEVIVVFEDVQRNVYFAKTRFIAKRKSNSLLTRIEILSLTDIRIVEENFDYAK